MALSDYKWLFRTDTIELVSSENPHGDYYTFDFKAPNSTWITGEHGFFSLTEKIKSKSWRAFSVASNQEEGIIKIATKIGDKPSEFKQILKNMQVGTQMKLRGPFGSFRIQDESSPIVLIAGWIGIAPMRAFLDRLKHDTSREVVLLYSARDGYLFEDEFNQIAQNNPSITLHYLNNRQELTRQIKKYSIKYADTAYYYLSGTIPMIKWATDVLTQNNISKKHILNDPFYGY